MTKADYYRKLFTEVDGCIIVTPLTRDLHSKEGSVLLKLIAKVWVTFIVDPEKAFAEYKLEFEMIRNYHANLPRPTNT